MKWEDLKPEQQEIFNNVNPGYLMNKCFMCKRKFDKSLLYIDLEQKRTRWNIEYLLHVEQTHGLPPEVVVERLRNV